MFLKLLGFIAAIALVAFKWPAVAAMLGGLCLLILVHELGHWSVARMLGFKTPVFAIGFGPRSWSIVLGNWLGTEWRLSPILLGGYVSIPELQDESTANEILKNGGEEQPQAKFFPVWKRTAVAVAGVTFNVIFSVILAFALFVGYGKPSVEIKSTFVHEVTTTGVTIAHDAGIQKGDVFVKVGANTVKTPDDLKNALSANKGQAVDVTLDRAGTPVTVNVTPNADGRIGIMLGVNQERNYTPVGVGQAASDAVKVNVNALGEMVKGIGMMVGLVEKPADLPEGATDVHGVVGIVQIGAQAFEDGLFSFTWILIMLGLNLAIMNILPFPPLDGGYVVFFAIEKITGKPLNANLRARISAFFFFALLALMVLGLFNDITKPLGK